MPLGWTSVLVLRPKLICSRCAFRVKTKKRAYERSSKSATRNSGVSRLHLHDTTSRHNEDGSLYQAVTPQSVFKPSRSPLNLSLSHAPMPGTECGWGPTFPSVYCHSVQVGQLAGT